MRYEVKLLLKLLWLATARLNPLKGGLGGAFFTILAVV
jgi:hypothetical protein